MSGVRKQQWLQVALRAPYCNTNEINKKNRQYTANQKSDSCNIGSEEDCDEQHLVTTN